MPRIWFSLMLLGPALAWGSGTITPGSKPGGKGCATATLEGSISQVDVEQKTFTVAGKNGTRSFKAGADTVFRLPGATKEEAKNAPLSKMKENARVKVFYCGKDGTPVEVKVER